MTLLLGAPATTVVTGLQPNKASVSGHPGHTSLSQAPRSEDTSRLRGTETSGSIARIPAGWSPRKHASS